MPASLFVEWMAYFKVEPFGAPLLDTHLATFEAMFYNANRGKNDRKRNAKDFSLHTRSLYDTQRELWNRLKGWARMFGKKE